MMKEIKLIGMCLVVTALSLAGTFGILVLATIK